MPTVYSPVRNFSGQVAGVAFDDGKATTDDSNALSYFRRHGYGIGKRPSQATPKPDEDAAPAVPVAAPTADGPPAFDPAKHSVEEVNAHLDQADDEERARVLGAEDVDGGGKGRKGIVEGPHATPAE